MTNPPADKTPRLNAATLGRIVLFLMIISASVIVTDVIAIRNRTPATTQSATTTSPSP